MFSGRTFRLVDGERIAGSWRYVFIKNGPYHLSQLRVYADGMVGSGWWGLINVATFREYVRAGFVATVYEEGAIGSVSGLASWRFAEPTSQVTAQGLIDEVADEVERLAGRPTAEDRFLAALNTCLNAPGADQRELLSHTYHAVPEHCRILLLADPKQEDLPIRTLITPVGQALAPGRETEPPGQPVTQEDHDRGWDYLRGWCRDQEQGPSSASMEDDAVTVQPSVVRLMLMTVALRSWRTVTKRRCAWIA